MNKYYNLIIILFLLSINNLNAQTVGVPTSTSTTNNGTTVTVTTTPSNITTTNNTPKIGDITTTITSNVSTVTTTPSSPANTGNVLPNNFCSEWTGTQVSNGQTSDLGCNYLTGKGTSSYAEWQKSLANIGISSELQKNGFTQSADAQTGFFWNNPQSLTMSQSVINNSTGETITQNRTLSKGVGSDSNYMTRKYLDNIVISSNNNLTGYTSKLRFDFSSSGSGSTWQGADVTSANLSIAYMGAGTSTTVNSISVTTSVLSCESLNTCFTPPPPPPAPTQISEPNFTAAPPPTVEAKIDPNFTMLNPMSKPMAVDNLTSLAPNSTVSLATQGTTQGATETKMDSPTPPPPAAKETTNTLSSPTPPPANNSTANNTSSTGGTNATNPPPDKEASSNNKTADTKQDTKTEDKQTSTSKSDMGENKKTEGSQTQTANEKNVPDTKTGSTEKGSTVTNAIDTKVKAAIDKVERELKTIDAKTKAIQEIKLDGIKAGAPSLSAYEGRQFYESKQLVGVINPDFFNQINIQQQQIYKDATLVAYINKDPIAVRQALQSKFEEEENMLRIEIEMLKQKGKI